MSFLWLTLALFSKHQCSGSPTQSVWPTSAPCGVMLLCSSASSPQLSRSTSVWCLGRKTLSPSSQVGNIFPEVVFKDIQKHTPSRSKKTTPVSTFLLMSSCWCVLSLYDHVSFIWLSAYLHCLISWWMIMESKWSNVIAGLNNICP